jgi:hypothetical protein
MDENKTRRMLLGLGVTALFLAAALPTSQATEASGPKYACKETDDDWGWGGSDVSCTYDCMSNSVIGLTVVAEDTDAGAEGSTKCGGQEVKCREHNNNECGNVSQGLTTSGEQAAECKGESHETWDSPMTVACTSTGYEC